MIDEEIFRKTQFLQIQNNIIIGQVHVHVAEIMHSILISLASSRSFFNNLSSRMHRKRSKSLGTRLILKENKYLHVQLGMLRWSHFQSVPRRCPPRHTPSRPPCRLDSAGSHRQRPRPSWPPAHQEPSWEYAGGSHLRDQAESSHLFPWSLIYAEAYMYMYMYVYTCTHTHLTKSKLRTLLNALSN